MSPSSIRCRGPWKLHKRSSEPDRWLDELGFFRKHTARDSSCLFRAVSENVYNTQRYYHKVRIDCVQFMASKPHLLEGSLPCPLENYLKEMVNPSEWGGLIEISAMSHLYRRDFVIFEANKGPKTKICNGYGDTIYLFHSPDTNHFDVVYTKEFIDSSSFCQSLVYEILYDGVYQLKDLSYAVDKMLHEKLPTNHIEYFMAENVERRKKQKERAKIFIEAAHNDDKDRNNNAVALKCRHHTQDLERASLLKESLSIFVFNRSLLQLENVCMNCLNVNSAKDLLDNGITPFPYKVAKALDPDIYRNIEFDVWSDLRREQRYGARYSDGTTLQVGVKCLCKLESDQSVPYHCHIQEMRPEGGPCLVFIEELGEKRIVKYDQLEPLPIDEVRPWAPPYRFSRAHSHFLSLSQMLKQIGNITRKQSLNKARNKAKTSTEETKLSEKATKPTQKLYWKEKPEDLSLFANQGPFDYPTYQHLDLLNFEPMPVEVQALPLMVDCRAGAVGGAGGAGGGAGQQDHATPNGAIADTQHNNQSGASGDMSGGHGLTPPAARASTPATNNAINTYPAGGMSMPLAAMAYVSGGGGAGGSGGGGAGGAVPYSCGMKSVVWCSPQSPPPPPHALPHLPHPAPPHAPHPPHPPPHVNPHVYKSVQLNGADLPMNDIPTLRYYFNLGVECMWASYGPPPPHRHYSPRDMAQDMQQMSIQDRSGGDHHSNASATTNKHGGDHHSAANKHSKPQLNAQPKGNGQRPLLGPRFKRGNNQDGNQNNNHNQNKGHNNNMGNKGPNNRRNSQADSRPLHSYGGAGEAGVEAAGVGAGAGGAECLVEAVGGPMLGVPYIPYPPPLYPIPYYPVDADPGMMGMMSGMSYVGYDEGEYGPALQPYYAAHFPPPPPPPHHHHAPPPHHHHNEHK